MKLQRIRDSQSLRTRDLEGRVQKYLQFGGAGGASGLLTYVLWNYCGAPDMVQCRSLFSPASFCFLLPIGMGASKGPPCVIPKAEPKAV